MSYDEVLARQRAEQDDSRYSGASAAIDVAGCLPGFAGLIVVAVVGVVALVWRRLHRT